LAAHSTHAYRVASSAALQQGWGGGGRGGAGCGASGRVCMRCASAGACARERGVGAHLCMFQSAMRALVLMASK
jgi:hypothetical protein